MTPQELKNSILQRAIQGRLVEQRPEEGTGEELYRKIQAEKQRLVKEGTIRKEKPLPEITEDEIPFDIPESWKWVRLGFCSTYAQPKEKIAADNIQDNIWTLDLEDIEKDTGKIIRYVNVSERKIIGDKVCFYKGQVLYSKLRPYLRKILVSPQDGICTPELVPFSLYGNISSSFVAYILKSTYADSVINAASYGIKMPRAGTETMIKLLIPLPPVTEQERIVAKVEELLAHVDRYAAAWNRLETFKLRFPSDMRKSLLQLAIQGRLVEQRPEEGTGEELYREIQAEKHRKILSGELKKEKPLPEISEDEIPFEIPESWKWVRVGEVGSWSAGATPSRGNIEYYNGNIPWLKTGDLNDGEITTISECISEKALSETSVRLNPVGSVLIAMYGATIGKLGILTIEATTNQACCACIPYAGILNKFLFYYLMANRTAFSKMAEGGAQPNISKFKIVNSVFPLPPFAEQQRIVERLEKLLPLCGRLR